MDDTFDLTLRSAVYRHFANTGQSPTLDDMGAVTGATSEQVMDGYRRLYAKRMLVPAADFASIRMAPPFSGISTQHRAIVSGKEYFANCAFSLAESPVGLAAWLIDHDPHSYEQIVRAFQGRPDGSLTRDEILDNITLYWVTNTGTSAARLYWEAARIPYKGQVTLPTAFTVFPGELYRAPRSWVERTYTNLIYFNEVDKGGHFAAWEQPQLLAEEVRAAFKSLR